MPGVGKSVVGKNLAQRLNYHLIDLDSYIEKKAKASIPELFNISEAHFRDLESLALKDINEDNLVVSCGGGIVTRLSNKDLMDGIIIYLNLPLELLEARINNNARPLLKDYTLKELYKKRCNSYYYFAKHIITNYSLDDTLREIIRRLNYENFNN